MDLHLSDKIAIVTGASKGIGLAITQALVDGGAYVVAGSRSRGPDLGALEESGKVTFVSADLSQPDGADELVAAAAERGGIDVLVNNVGAVAVHPGGFETVTDDEWQKSWDLNVMGTVRPTRAALPQMYRRGGGSIVIVGSVNAYFPDPGIYDYCATKAAVTNFRQSLVEGIGSEEHSSQLHQPRTCDDPDVAGRRRRRRHDRRCERADRGGGQGRDGQCLCDRPVLHAATGRRPGRVPGQ